MHPTPRPQRVHELAGPPRPRIGYARVSTDAQDISIDAQVEQLQAWARMRGVDDLRIEIDHGHSGKSLERPAITVVLEELAAKGGTLVVCKLDRLTRSVVDFANLMADSRAQGWQLVAMDLGVDTTTPAGELVATIMAAIAQWERRVIGERTRTSLAHLANQGVRLGRPSSIPIDILERITALRAAGQSYQAIADTLNDDQVPTARGASAWRKSTVRTALGTAALNLQAAERADLYASGGSK